MTDAGASHRLAITETMAFYDECVDALLDAYNTGTPEAMRRHWRLTWHQRAWKAMRTYVQVDLGKQAADNIEITRDDARWLVAREHGFENWSSLSSAVTDSPRPARLTVKPFGLMARGHDDTPSHDESMYRSRDWDDVLRRLARADCVGLDAHGQMTDELLRDVVQNPQLTTLRLGGSAGVTDEGIRLLARLPQLTFLDLQGTSISDAGMRALRDLPSLQHLSLAWTRVSDDGAAQLAPLSQLTHVDLQGTTCGDGALRALSGKPTLRHLSTGSATSDEGLSLLQGFPAFAESNTTARSAATSWSGDGDAPNRLQLRGAITSSGLTRLVGLNGLCALDVDDERLALRGAALAPLVQLANLLSLSCHADDDAMHHIGQMPHLRVLGVQDTPASDRGWRALGASRTIERIWGRRCYGLQTDGFLALSQMPALRVLSVSCKNVSDRGIASLPEFPALRELMPMDIPDAGYVHIGRCRMLTSLVLMYCRDTTDTATETLTPLEQLTDYFASYTQITDRTPELLSTITSLERIVFDSCAQLTDSGIAKLATLPNLRELGVRGRGVTADVVSAFPDRVRVRFAI